MGRALGGEMLAHRAFLAASWGRLQVMPCQQVQRQPFLAPSVQGHLFIQLRPELEIKQDSIDSSVTLSQVVWKDDAVQRGFTEMLQVETEGKQYGTAS